MTPERENLISTYIITGAVIIILAAIVLVFTAPDEVPSHTSFTLARPHCKLHPDTIDCTIKHLPR
jgi:hypothetical protein